MGLSVIDTIMAGRLSAVDLAAVALGGAVYGTVYVAAMGIIQALTPIAGHHYGAGKPREVGIDLAQMLWLSKSMRQMSDDTPPVSCTMWRSAWP
jgi:MATE family multidrug resistance protein